MAQAFSGNIHCLCHITGMSSRVVIYFLASTLPLVSRNPGVVHLPICWNVAYFLSILVYKKNNSYKLVELFKIKYSFTAFSQVVRSYSRLCHPLVQIHAVHSGAECIKAVIRYLHNAVN